MVKVFTDIVSKDEMISDGYPMTEKFEGAAFEVQGKLIITGQEDLGMPENPGEDDVVEEGKAAPGEIPQGDTVIDVVHHFNLMETKHDKKSFQNFVKGKHNSLIFG